MPTEKACDCKRTQQPTMQVYEKACTAIRYNTLNIDQTKKALAKVFELQQKGYQITGVSGWAGDPHQVEIKLERLVTTSFETF